MLIKLPELHCLRCGHRWIPRKYEVTICPECKSPYWDKPKRKKKSANLLKPTLH
jgi:Zn finger protein HypA/HybF involved in hydrogenase expression